MHGHCTDSAANPRMLRQDTQQFPCKEGPHNCCYTMPGARLTPLRLLAINCPQPCSVMLMPKTRRQPAQCPEQRRDRAVRRQRGAGRHQQQGFNRAWLSRWPECALPPRTSARCGFNKAFFTEIRDNRRAEQRAPSNCHAKRDRNWRPALLFYGLLRQLA